MANFFSDHFTNTVGGTSPDSPRIKVKSGILRSKIYYSRSVVTIPTTVLAGDVVRFTTLKSSDRIQELMFTKAVTTTATELDVAVGFYESGQNNDGPVVDVDLFGVATDFLPQKTRSDLFRNGGQVVKEDWGKALYELVDIGLASALYDNDPLANWDLAFTVITVTGIPAAASEVVCEIRYTSNN